MKGNQRASLPLNLKFRLQKIKFWNWILNDECFVVPLFWDVWSSFLSILFYFIWISPFRKKNLIDFCSPLKYIYIYIYFFFFLKFEIWNLEFETFFLKKDTLCSWSSSKFFFIHPFLFFSLLKDQNKNFIYFFFWELTESTQWNLSWLSNPGEIKGGAGGEFFGPPSPSSSSFYFTSPSSLFSLLALSLFTHFLHLHFLPPHTISSLENHFPKLLNLLSFISLNIFFSIY